MSSAKQITDIVRRSGRSNWRATILKKLGLGLFLVLLTFGTILYTRVGTHTRVYAAASNNLNFQARLLTGSGSIVADGNYSVQFNLYNVATGGSTQWTETQGSVVVKGGYLSAYLGSVTPFPGTIDWSQKQWLTMNINGDGEMNPRLQLTAVPNALHANESDALRSGSNLLTADSFAQLAPSSVQVINSALAALRLNQTGAGLLAQWQGNGSDVFTVAKTGDLTSSGSGTFSGGSLTLGTATQIGGLVLKDGVGKKGTIQTTALSADQTYTLPNASGTICLTTTCSGAANAFVNGGNSFGSASSLGNNDNFSLTFRTSNANQLTLDTSGNLNLLNGGLQVGSTSVLTNARVLQNVTASTSILTSGILGTARGGTGVDGSGATNGQLLIGNGSGGFTLATIANNGGLTISNSAGGIGLAVNYGSSSTSAVRGDTSLICPSGTGNLNGTGNTITLGTGGTCNALDTKAAVAFTTSVTTPVLTNAGALTVSTTGANDLTLTSGSGLLVLNASTVRRTAAGSTTFDLVDGSNTTMAFTNSGAGNLNLSTDGTITAGAGLVVTSGGASITGNTSVSSGTFTASGGLIKLNDAASFGTSINTGSSNGTITLGGGFAALVIDSTAFDVSATGALSGITTIVTSSTINTNTFTGTNLTFGGASGAVSTTGNGNLTVGPAGSGVLALNTGSAGTLTTNASTIQRSGATGLILDLANAGPTTLTVTNSDASNVANLSVEGGITAGTNSAFSVNSDGDITSVARQLDGSSTANGGSGFGSSTSLALTSAANFDVGNYVRVTSANCGGTGVNPCYAKITAKATNTLTITPALTWTTGAAVVEFHIPEIGGVDTSQTLANRYGRGYFISGVAAGNGTTYYNENSIETSLTTFDLLNTGVTTLNIGGAATTLNLGNASGTTTIAGTVNFSGNSTAPNTGTAGYLSRSGTTLQPANAGDNFTTSGNISTSSTGTITAAAGLTVQSGGASVTGGLSLLTGALNLTSGGITNAGSITGVGSNLTATAGLIIASGGSSDLTLNSASNVIVLDGTETTLRRAAAGSYTFELNSALASSFVLNNTGAGAASLVLTDGDLSTGSTPTIRLTNTGALTNITGLTLTSGGINVASGGITNAGAISGIAGLTFTSGSLNIASGGITNAGSIGGVAGLTFISGSLNLASGGITNAGSIIGIGTNLTGAAALTIGTSSGDVTIDPSGNLKIIGSTSDNTAGALNIVNSGGATSLLFVRNDGNVGIGTATPGAKLEVKDGGLRLTNSTDAKIWDYSYDPVQGYVYFDEFGLNRRMVIQNGGNVGIGDTSPLATFTVGSGDLFQVAGATGNIQTNGALTVLTGGSISGAAVNFNVSSNFATNINTGTSTGTVTIGGGSASLVIDSTNFDVTSAGALSGITTLNASGLVTAGGGLIQATGTGAAVIINRTDGVIGSLKSGSAKVAFFFDDTGSFSISKDTRANIAAGTGAGTDLLLVSPNGNITVTAGLSGLTTLSLSGAITGATATNTINGLVINAGALSGITGMTFTSGGLNLANGGITNAGAISGVTTFGASGLATISGGATISGAAINLNATSNFAVNIGTGTTNGTISIGGGSAPLVINSTAFDVSSAGALSGITTIDTSGNINTSAGVYQVGGTSGLTIAACTAGQYIGNGVATKGGIITAGTCRTDATGISDIRLKKNITSVGSVLDKIKDLNVVTFDFKVTELPELNLDHGLQYGVIAQEIEQVFPELVSTREDGYKQVNFQGLNFYNLRAVGELAKKVDTLSQNAGSPSGNINVDSVATKGTVRLDANGTLQNITGLSVVGGGMSLAGGLNNTGGGFTNVGLISGATNIGAQSIDLKADASDNLLTLSKDGAGVFTVFNNGALELRLDATNAFAVKNKAGGDIFTINTTGGLVQIGTGAADDKAILLVLDSKTTVGDPAGVNGAQYYNASSEKFRCYQDGHWQDCLAASYTEYILNSLPQSWMQPSTEQEFPGNPRTFIDLSNAKQFRIVATINHNGVSATKCRLQYALGDTGPWADLTMADGAGAMPFDSSGTVKGNWYDIVPAARKDVMVRIMCKDTNNVTTNNIGTVRTQIK